MHRQRSQTPECDYLMTSDDGDTGESRTPRMLKILPSAKRRRYRPEFVQPCRCPALQNFKAACPYLGHEQFRGARGALSRARC